MAKTDYGMATGKCVVCTINLWDSADNKPVIYPCGIDDCPYESKAQKDAHLKLANHSPTGSGLGQIIYQ